ncbi:penicillin-binding transpeptidase domain-containing protein [Loigolactobacillus rennini]|uniref:Penicillin-binding protein 3 n=1 Tax=Loigolactobacillus rennini DSM 20253 TaxID=1423796 RepID=A0A0R2D501_9LACO|nr:penicillin-binding transpeptidase domain-containing protein [Loigolactobacillus rennini]KRM98725.1 penicillin-binding protein 3 [Loigolactobacillus rennini DSM 20253]
MKKKHLLLVGLLLLLLIAGGSFYYQYWHQQQQEKTAVKQVARAYTKAFSRQDFKQMVRYVDHKQLTGGDYRYTSKQVVARNVAVFGRIGANQLNVKNLTVRRQKPKQYQMTFDLHLQTMIGPLNVKHYQAAIQLVKHKWRVVWTPTLLFPHMNGTDTVQLQWQQGKRGKIVDRHGKALAVDGQLTQAGMIPDQLGQGHTRTERLTAISQQFDVDLATLKQSLQQNWVTKTSFVPIKKVKQQPKLTGVTYRAVSARTYPSGAASAQLIGYVGPVTAADLKKHPQLQSNGTIGKTGLERYYDAQLQGRDGGTITINNDDNVVRTLLKRKKSNGKTIKLTLDRTKQEKAYRQLAGQKGAIVVMDPRNGQLLTLAGAPSYDPNQFVAGISQKAYQKYAQDKAQPFLSRFTQRYAPGSTFKMITAGIALDNGTITPATTRRISGLKWQQDRSWGDYQVTRVKDAATENMTQALVNSDNIWFAQTALKMGSQAYLNGLQPFFKPKLKLPLTMQPAQISNNGKLDRQILLADTAYGQGQLLLSPIQQATFYSSVMNQGNMQLPTLIAGQAAKRQAVLKQASADQVKQALVQVVADAQGTGHALQIAGHNIAAKTGTAELKLQQDTTGKQNGFLMAADADQNRYLMVALLEDNGSDAVIKATKPLVESFY